MITRKFMIIFNGGCGMCASLAKQIQILSRGKINAISIHTEEAQEELRKFYPEGVPFNYFLIERTEGKARCHMGVSGLVRLVRLLPVTGSVKLLHTYLHFKAHGTILTERMLQPIRSEHVESPSHSDRRSFLKLMTIGAVALAVGQMGLSRVDPVQAALTKAVSQTNQ